MHIQCPESLRAYNTLALSAQAAALVRITDTRDLVQALEWAEQRQLPVVTLGQGSNIVIADDLQALVLCMATTGREILAQDDSSISLRVQAGEDWHALVGWTLDQGYHGLENLALIPGTVGAAPIQNIGAYGVELNSMVETVHALDLKTRETLKLSNPECEFAYRDSVFKGRFRDRFIITALDLTLSRQPRLQLGYPALAEYLERQSTEDVSSRDVFAAVVDIRQSRLPDPALEPNAGSFFKNPVVSQDKAHALQEHFPELPCYAQDNDQVKLPAAWLIEACGWKGKREGDVGIHPGHALVMVNYGAAIGADLLGFARRIEHSVSEKFGVPLEIEPRVYGQNS